MTANDSAEKTEDRSLNNHAALKTSIANGDVEEVKARLEGHTLDKLETLFKVKITLAWRILSNEAMCSIGVGRGEQVVPGDFQVRHWGSEELEGTPYHFGFTSVSPPC